uniref:Uncharacterized protein n=1 Tax=Glossina brevipalpis TaxID=37001 RepID=A0A1A9WMV3_9MUSC
MYLTPSLIGGWDKLENFDHYHLIIFALLVVICAFEGVVLKVTLQTFLHNRPYIDSGDSSEYEEDTYYEEESNMISFNRRTFYSELGQEQQQRQPINGKCFVL